MARQYNFIYKRLVKNESDIVGNIAYSLYKADKIKFIEDFKAKNGGNEPTEADFQPFHDICCMDANINRYQMQAINILQGFLDDTLSATTKQIEKDLESNYKKELMGIVGKTTVKSFSWNVFQSVVGAFVFYDSHVRHCLSTQILRSPIHVYHRRQRKCQIGSGQKHSQ